MTPAPRRPLTIDSLAEQVSALVSTNTRLRPSVGRVWPLGPPLKPWRHVEEVGRPLGERLVERIAVVVVQPLEELAAAFAGPAIM